MKFQRQHELWIKKHSSKLGDPKGRSHGRGYIDVEDRCEEPDKIVSWHVLWIECLCPPHIYILKS